MKTRYVFTAVLAAMAMAATAQETYQDAKLMTGDLNGTARYVGMGGAMEALGADISTISTNPAGLGLFRRGQVTISGGMISQGDAETSFSYNGIQASINGNKTNMSFDQIGVVLPLRLGKDDYLNLGFNYHKSRNFDQILTAGASLANASQNKLSAVKYSSVGDMAWNGVDANYASILTSTDDSGNKSMGYYNGSAYLFGQYQKGYIGEYDFSMSGALGDRAYLGFSLGLYDVNYHSNSYYTEDLESNAVAETWETLKIDGQGFDFKLGAIVRPIEESAFRIGAYIHSPIFYDLSLYGVSDLTMSDGNGSSTAGSDASYDFKLRTPWKFGLSLGHTVGNVAALGATYEYADYGSADNRINDGGYYDTWYGNYYEASSSDETMNSHTKRTLKGVHTLKLGAEIKATPSLAFRAGYNFISSAYENNGFRDGSLESPGVAYATSTDYTNWKSTNRFTLGLGYQVSKFNVDLAYQYSQTNGDFYPFMSYEGDKNPEYDNVATSCSVSNKRHQLLLTLGYRF